MSDLNTILNNFIVNVDGAVGASVIDLNSGLLIGAAHSEACFTQPYIDALAASAVEVFRGKTITIVEEIISSARDEKVENIIQEVQMTTANTYLFMMVHPKKSDSLVVLVTTKKTNLGMAWASVRSFISDIEPHCP